MLAIAVCIGALCFYKYSIFFLNSVFGQINPEAGKVASAWAKNILPQAPPLGISFFAFEFVHYLYDVRSGTPPLRNFFQFTAFSIFFPSLVAGPIKRFEQFIPSLKEGVAKVNAQDAVVGIVQVAFGYLKKVIADNLTLYLDTYQDKFADLHLDQRWFLFTAIAFVRPRLFRFLVARLRPVELYRLQIRVHGFQFSEAPPERFFEARSSSQDQEADVLPIPQRFTLQGQSMRFLRMFIDRRCGSRIPDRNFSII